MFPVLDLKFPEKQTNKEKKKHTRNTWQMTQMCFTLEFKDKSFFRSLLRMFINHTVMISFNNAMEGANFMLFPMYSKAHLNIFGLL